MSVVKVTFEGEVRRGRVEEVTYEGLVKVVNELVPVQELVLRYEDEDGDVCMLTEQTFDDFVDQCKGGSLRVTAAGHRGRRGRVCPGKIWRQLQGEVTHEVIAELMVRHAEVAAVMVERKAWKLDRVAWWWPEKVRPVIAVVVESLRDIPEMTTCRAGLEHVLDEELAGLGQAVSDLAREFVVQPVEVQKRVAEALGVHLVPLIDRLRGGRRVVCGRCDERIWGGRMKCRECPGYDLCEGCYEKRGEFHGEHEVPGARSTTRKWTSLWEWGLRTWS
uniref:ZZ-type domain-containing protein n=1 Tax=Oxyrrhis marina TaxID=2969 RepID=A0A7S4GNQ4_OXYMA